jgi:hypothetical protein
VTVLRWPPLGRGTGACGRPVAAHEADAVAVLVGDDAPAVDLLLVDSAGTVERLANERGGHGAEPR